MSRYACSACRDIGWIEEPVASGDFEPTLQTVSCPHCNPHVATPSWTKIALIILAFFGLLALVAWGPR